MNFRDPHLPNRSHRWMRSVVGRTARYSTLTALILRTRNSEGGRRVCRKTLIVGLTLRWSLPCSVVDTDRASTYSKWTGEGDKLSADRPCQEHDCQ